MKTIIANTLLGLLVVGMFAVALFALNKNIDRWALDTCAKYNDCEAVAKTIK